MSQATAQVAVDIGTASITIARDCARADTSPAPVGGWSAALAGLRSAAPLGGLCLAVPDAWLDGSVAGTAAQEEARHLAEDEHGLGPIRWAGQLSAVAALTARDHGPGRYLICDVGASGVRVVSAQIDDVAPGEPAVSGTASGDTAMIVTTIGAHHADGGWRDFDTSLRAELAVDGRRLPADWYHLATTEKEDLRARLVLGQAIENVDYAGTRAYSLAGAGNSGIIAAELISCFAAIRSVLTVGIAEVTSGRRPDVTVLTGGFGWFPLVEYTVTAVLGTSDAAADPRSPKVVPAKAAAQGALLFTTGQAAQATAPPLVVTLSAYRISGGLLETAEVPLEWTRPFADLAEGPVHLEGDELMLTINGNPITVPLPGIKPGPHLIGIRRGWSGAAALVVRPVAGGTPRVTALVPGTDR